MADEKKDSKTKPVGSIAARAWNATKAEGDPEYRASGEAEFWGDIDFRARKVQETGTAITNFEKEVQRLAVEDKKEQAALGGPMAVVDEATPIEGAKATAAKKPAAKSTTKAGALAKGAKAKGTQKTDKSGHVPTAKEAAATVKEQATSPKHP